MRHRGEVALVTGANKGIGREIARRLAAEGMTVYAGSRDPDRGALAVAALNTGDSDVRFVQLDVTDAEQARAAARRIDEEHGKLDVLVNNAGTVGTWGAAVDDVTADDVRDTFEVNVLGVINVTHACIPLLLRSSTGRIVNLSSPLGSLTALSDPDHPIAGAGLVGYSASKAALNAVTLLYANHLRAAGIRVNAANPGLVATDLNRDSPRNRGNRTPEQGADVPVALALLDADGPTGTFRGGDGTSAEDTVPW
ncbi:MULTISPECIES: SDR family NAD(P)-dependent oxidoreductase [Streptomyces]|uniref:SDR family NAD(P)-dependent oxidoreductase n=1 Tax=Streptomyces TaxID=1883 RepID=UPI00163CFFCB|nr:MULTISPECIES: SDR family NAD(P)-dependent oxidoreductase [Streptomyces]MBC2877877.1 SDR family NAD(P)-dependent oxidoreductase [Streptomyces sp. TYQ1024]UBI38013.1 SDR family NAD(P)-dependent oxidoreductase [Streptomyces mobaraensis]UKW30600.1 SDR family NAD(P)-dependent oxidoreductase [Streptomyces sp. TYQ1024]